MKTQCKREMKLKKAHTPIHFKLLPMFHQFNRDTLSFFRFYIWYLAFSIQCNTTISWTHCPYSDCNAKCSILKLNCRLSFDIQNNNNKFNCLLKRKFQLRFQLVFQHLSQFHETASEVVYVFFVYKLNLINVTMTSKLLYSAIGRADRTLLTCGVNRQMRNFFAYLRIAFNKVDTHRLEEVGPDRLCAEW